MPHSVSRVTFRLILQAILALYWIATISLFAFASEDVEVPDDEEMRLPKQTVTGKRGGGGSASLGSILSVVSGGSLSDINALGLHGDAYVFALACRRNPGSIACRELACEIDENSKECEHRLDKIIVTGERPETPDFTNNFTVSVEFSPKWFVKVPEQTEEEKKEQQRKKLEEQCRAAYAKIFSDLDDFNFGFTFGSAVGGSVSATDGRAKNKSAQAKLLSQLVDLTKPIMTTGVNGGKPVEYKKGQEAVTGLYLNVIDNKLTRGTHVAQPQNYRGVAKREFHLDDQFKHTKKGGAEKVTQRLIVDFHTHPLRISGEPSVPYFAWPSVQDIFLTLVIKLINVLIQTRFSL